MAAVMTAPAPVTAPAKAESRKQELLYSIFPQYMLCLDKAKFEDRLDTDGRNVSIRKSPDRSLQFVEHICPCRAEDVDAVKAAPMYGYDFMSGSDLYTMVTSKNPAIKVQGQGFLEKMERRSKVGGGKLMKSMDLMMELSETKGQIG